MYTMGSPAGRIDRCFGDDRPLPDGRRAVPFTEASKGLFVNAVVLERGERPLFQAGDLSVDLVRRIVTVRGSEVKLTPREYEVLRLMMAHAGKVLTHHLIVQEIWGRGANVQYLRIYICALRQKIEADPERPSIILTEIGVGYRLRERLDLIEDIELQREAAAILARGLLRNGSRRSGDCDLLAHLP